MKNFDVVDKEKLRSIREDMLTAIESNDMVLAKMCVNNLDTLIYRSEENKEKIQADIRNKLTPPLNLASIVRYNIAVTDRVNELTLSEADKTTEVVEYLSNLINKEEYD